MYFITHSFLMKALGAALVNSFWQLALMWLICVLINGSNKRLTSAARHGISLILLLAGSAWFIVGFLINLMGSGNKYVWSNPDGWEGRAFPAGSGIIQQVLSPVLPYLSMAYLVIILYLAIRHSANHLHVIRIRRKGLHKVQPRIKLFVETISQRMGIHRKVNIWLSDLVDGPLTLGFYKPIILFPLAMINQLSMDQVEAIILHELAHIRRSDYVINLLISWLGMIFFFNPFARMLIREIRRQREHCCDDLVLQFQYEPHAYASALLSLERSRFQHSALVLAAAGRSRRLLLERVMRLSGQKPASRRFGFSAMAVLFISLTGAQFLTLNPLPATALNRPEKSHVKLDKAQIEFVTARYVETRFQTKPKITASRKQAGHGNKNEVNDLVLVSSNKYEEDPSPEVVSAVGFPEDRESSISNSVTPPKALSPVNLAGHPYVPNTSFTYHIQIDTSMISFAGKDKETQYALENVTLALNALDGQAFYVQSGLADRADQNLVEYFSQAGPGGKYLELSGDMKSDASKELKRDMLALKKTGARDKQTYIFLQKTIHRNQLLIQKQQLENELKVLRIEPKKNKRTIVDI